MRHQRRDYRQDERPGWRAREERGSEGSWRDQGDGGYFEPSRGRWDDDRRYTGSRQDQNSDRGPYDASFDNDVRYATDDRDGASYGNDGRYGAPYGPDTGSSGRGWQREWSASPHGFGGSYGRGAGRYSDIDRGYRTFDRDASWSGERGGWNPWNREAGSSTDTGEPSYAGRGPKDYQRSDERIREEISDRLTDDHRVDATDIVVEVKSCEVTLSGTVADRDQKRRAEDLAESVSGVRDVSNHLRVSRSEEDRARTSGTSTSGNKPKSGSRLP